MTDTVWADFSQYQADATDAYPYRWASFRSNDGTYQDTHFTANLAWADGEIASGRMDAFIVYVVYEPDNEAWASTAIKAMTPPSPHMAVMIDVESWGGRIQGDHSADINKGRAQLAQWLGSPKRVLGYGNTGDLADIWRTRGDTQFIIAAYGSNPPFPNKIAHQYTDTAAVAPFTGPVDMNSADGLTSEQLAARLGLTPAAQPATNTAPAAEEEDEEMPNSGIYWEPDAKTVIYATFNTVSGFWQAFSNGTGNGPLPSAYVNGVSNAFHTGAFASVTASHAAVIKAACAAVTERQVTGDVQATIETTPAA